MRSYFLTKRERGLPVRKEYCIPTEADGRTVKSYVLSTLGFSVRNLKAMKYRGSIVLDGEPVFVTHTVRAGQTLVLEYPEETSETVIPEDIPLDVLYEDDDYLCVNKPHGMPSHPSFNHPTGTLANAVMYYYRDRPFTFRILTRLDTDTTGATLVAKNALSASTFLKCEPQKTYIALCVAAPEPRSGTIIAPIARNPASIISRMVCETGKPSVTRYETLQTWEARDGKPCALVQAIPLTGRTHQIRVHLTHIGCPLYGDYLYGTEIPGERTRLHCREVSFRHISTGERICIQAPLPEDFLSLFAWGNVL